MQGAAIEDGVGGGGQRAVTAELGEERPLGVDAAAGRRVLDASEASLQVLVVGPALDAEGSLGDLRQHHVGGAGARRSASARPSRSRAVDATTTASWSAALAMRVCMLPRRLTKRRSGRCRRSCTWRRNEPVATSAPVGQVGEGRPDQRVPRVAALGDGGQHEARDRGRRQVLGAVDGEVGPAVEHGGLHLLGEHALAAELPDRHVEPAVAVRCRRRRARPSTSGSTARSSAATCSACQRASGLPRVAARSVRTRRYGRRGRRRRSSRAKSSRRAATSRSPRVEPAASLSATDGSWSSLPMMPRVSASTASSCAGVERAEPAAVALELGLADLLGPVSQRDDHRGDLAGGGGPEVALELLVEEGLHDGHLALRGPAVPASAKARRSSMSRRVTPGRRPTAGSMSRGTAMSTISSGRPRRAATTRSRSSTSSSGVAAPVDGEQDVDVGQRR